MSHVSWDCRLIVLVQLTFFPFSVAVCGSGYLIHRTVPRSEALLSFHFNLMSSDGSKRYGEAFRPWLALEDKSVTCQSSVLWLSKVFCRHQHSVATHVKRTVIIVQAAQSANCSHLQEQSQVKNWTAEIICVWPVFFICLLLDGFPCYEIKCLFVACFAAFLKLHWGNQ